MKKNLQIIILILSLGALCVFLISFPLFGDIPDIISLKSQQGHGDLDMLLSMSESLLVNDSRYQKLVAGNETMRLLTLVHNRSCVEERYRAGFRYEEACGSRAARIVGGNDWRFLIDPGKGTVQPELMEWRPRHFCVNASCLNVKRSDTSILSFINGITIYPAPWLEDSGTWRYVLRVDSEGDVTRANPRAPLSGGSGCVECLCSVWKVQGSPGDYMDIQKFSPDRIQTWCTMDGEIEIDEDIERDHLLARFSYPRSGWIYGDWPSEGGYSYRFSINPGAESRVVLDIVTTLLGAGDGSGSDEVRHSWRVIIDAPPDPAGLSGDEFKAHDIWAADYGGYHHLSPVIVDFGEGGSADFFQWEDGSSVERLYGNPEG